MNTEPNAMTQTSKSYPYPAKLEETIGLCLSGGGFRAALYHLGVLRRLNELGLLSQVDAISSVSGGSILSAHLAAALPDWIERGTVLPADQWQSKVVEPFEAFVSKDCRTIPFIKGTLRKVFRKFPASAVQQLERCYQALHSGTLSDLPEHPRFVFCATDLVYGKTWYFEKQKVGSRAAGFLRPDAVWTVAQAVAASSCFPPVFQPMRLRLKPGQLASGHYMTEAERNKLNPQMALTDGGVYDNLGLEAVWNTYDLAFVSDGGSPFEVVDANHNFKRLTRYVGIIQEQVNSLRKRWLIAKFEDEQTRLYGCYMGLSTPVKETQESPGYSSGFVEDIVANIRTDLDVFSAEESGVLQNHGYYKADEALKRRFFPGSVDALPPAISPYPEFMDEAKMRHALRKSSQRFRFLPSGL